MAAIRIVSMTIAFALCLPAEDFTLRHFGSGPVALHTTLTIEPRAARLVATATNETGARIESARICILSPGLRDGCLFELWNTEPWEAGKELSWNVTARKRPANTTHDATLTSLQIEPPPTPPAPQAFATRPATPKPAVDILTNETVIKLSKAGLGDEVVVAMVNTQAGDFTVTPAAVIALKEAGVSDKVIAAVIHRDSSKMADILPSVSEVGLYFRKGSTWVDVKPEIVDRRTGGVVKNTFSLGIVKGDINGLVNGPSSPTIIDNPVELLLFSNEGVAATEYQLVNLHEHDNRREFRTVTGGVFHESEGATRDLIPFESRKIGPRLYRISLQPLASGEYGILPPNADNSNRASATLGKIYTFRVAE